MTSKDYDSARQLYWDQQREFRRLALAEITRLMPDRVIAVLLEINDTPRLSMAGFVTVDGVEYGTDEELEEWEEIDTVASDMEAFTWEEADSFLFRRENQFIIEREAVPA